MLTLKTIKQKTLSRLKPAVRRPDARRFSGVGAVFLQPVRILYLSVEGYIRDKCALRASALTFYSLLSVVPIVAMAFGVAKGFGLEQILENQLYIRLAGQEAAVERIIAFSRTLLENTKGGVVAGIGVAVLFWSAIKVLGHIEKALNDIWKVKPRSFIRRVTDYLAVMIVSPLLVIVSSSMNIYITTQVTLITEKLSFLHAASPLIALLLKLLPYGLVWLLFILIYMVMPNTGVRVASAVIAGVVGGTIYQLSQGFYISAQMLVAQYNAIYGSFAALPLFLVWLQVSWMIVLFGAQIAHAHQHGAADYNCLDYRKTGNATQKIIAIKLLKEILLAFRDGKPPYCAQTVADTLNLSPSLAKTVLDHLAAIGLLCIVLDTKSGEHAFAPARDIRTYRLTTVLCAWDGNDAEDSLLRRELKLEGIAATIADLRDACRRSGANHLIIDLQENTS